MNQNDRLLAWLQSGHTITPRYADEMWGCTRLGARIFDLKQMGHNIISEREDGLNKLGEKCHWARYRMGKCG